jgi:hypothetical protein
LGGYENTKLLVLLSGDMRLYRNGNNFGLIIMKLIRRILLHARPYPAVGKRIVIFGSQEATERKSCFYIWYLDDNLEASIGGAHFEGFETYRRTAG